MSEVITLCGSTRFKKEFREIERKLTLEGKIPLAPAIYGKGEGIEYSKEMEKILFKLQLEKIDLSNGIFVIDVDKYIGESTKKEIEYAKMKGKYIKYYSREKNE
jgi:hypothetical protein